MDFSSLAALIFKQQQYQHQQAAAMLQQKQQQRPCPHQQLHQHENQYQQHQSQQKLQAQILEASLQKEQQHQLVVAQLQQEQQRQQQALHFANSNYQSILTSLSSNPTSSTLLQSKQAITTELQKTNFLRNQQHLPINQRNSTEKKFLSLSSFIGGKGLVAPNPPSMVSTQDLTFQNIGTENSKKLCQGKNKEVGASGRCSFLPNSNSNEKSSRPSQVRSNSTSETKMNPKLNLNVQPQKQVKSDAELSTKPTDNLSNNDQVQKKQMERRDVLVVDKAMADYKDLLENPTKISAATNLDHDNTSLRDTRLVNNLTISSQNSVMDGNHCDKTSTLPRASNQNTDVKTSHFLEGNDLKYPERIANKDMDHNAVAISSLLLYVEQRKKEKEKMNIKNMEENLSAEHKQKKLMKTEEVNSAVNKHAPEVTELSQKLSSKSFGRHCSNDETSHRQDLVMNQCQQQSNISKENCIDNSLDRPTTRGHNFFDEKVTSVSVEEQRTEPFSGQIMATPDLTNVQSSGIQVNKITDLEQKKFGLSPNKSPSQLLVDRNRDQNKTNNSVVLPMCGITGNFRSNSNDPQPFPSEIISKDCHKKGLIDSPLADQTSETNKDDDKEEESFSLNPALSTSLASRQSSLMDDDRKLINPVKQENSKTYRRQSKLTLPTANNFEKIRPYGYNNPYKNITPEQIAKSIPQNASSIFHIFDRRVNLDAHPADASLYTLMRSWVKDDPYRTTESNNNLLEHITVPSMRRRQNLVPFSDFRPTDENQSKHFVRTRIDSHRRPYKKRKVVGMECDTCDILSQIRRDNITNSSKVNSIQPDKCDIQPDGNNESDKLETKDLLESHIKLAKLQRKDRMKVISMRMSHSRESLKSLGINLP